MLKLSLPRSSEIALLCVLLLTACATPNSPTGVGPVVVTPPRLPLPPEARAPARPPECVPTCQEGLRRLLIELGDSLKTDTLPPPPAKP